MKRNTRLVVLALVAMAGCAEERPPINRVQAVALQKSFFVGPKLRDTSDDPEFYMRGTVVDVGFGAAQDGLFTSTYAQPVSRIRWEITETFLNARLAYERIAGTDGKGNPVDGLRRKASNDGQIVATYRITSHFDIRNAYNPTTGEALNVVEENTTDRPWYDREYFRVDWSTNLATSVYDFDTLSMMGIYGSINYEPIPYAVTDEKHPDAPHFDLRNGYFDVTTKAFARPKEVDLSHLGWGIDKFPACYLPAEFSGGTAPDGNCNPVELTLRYSFKKVVDTDYEPVDWDGYRFQAYGYFFNEYMGYDRNYGMVDNKWFRFAARYNLWDRSHYYADPVKMTGEVACATHETTVAPTGDPNADPNRDLDNDGRGNGTADECEAVTDATGYGGSRCDVFKSRCTLPFRARTAKTIPWYINGRDDEDLFDATNWATLEWNLGMQTAVQTARLVECRRAGGGADCDNEYPMWNGQQDDYDDAARIGRELDACRRQNGWSGQCDHVVDDGIAALANERGNPNDPNLRAMSVILKMPPVIVLCHNPVIAGDSPACGAQGTAPRLGDLRYHTVLVIDKPQTPSAWGIMVDADDPVTGEKVAASINIWSHVTDLATTQLLDIVRYANGELATSDITNGQYVHNWVQAQRVNSAPTMSSEEVAQRLAGATKLDAQSFRQLTAAPLAAEVRDQMRSVQRQVRDVAAHASVPSATQALVDARMNLARGTPTEAQLINPAMLQLAGVPGNLPVTGPVAKLASPLGLNNPKVLSQLRHMRENALARRGACIVREAPEASAITGVADILKRKFPIVQGETGEERKARHDAMFRYLRRRYHYAVIAHEMGHSIGLRHNFVSSYGSLFFRPQYWQLRTRNGAVTTPCTEAVSDGASCVGPRYYDPITREEQDQLIWMFMQSTVMDYPGDVSQDMMGLGIYDYAAARMLYGDTVAVYSDTGRVRAGSPIGIGITNATDTFGGLVGIQYSVGQRGGPRDIHYSQLQNEYRLISDCYPITPRQPGWWREEVDGIWDPVLDGHFVAVNGEYKKCRQMPVDYAAWTQLRSPTPSEIGGGYYRGGVSVDPQGRLRVPYHFATDHWADLGNVSVFRHDNGADPYEQAMFLITTQENRHIFDNFRRGRTAFSPKYAADRSFSRYNEKLVNLSGGVAFLANIYRNFATQTGYTFDTLWPYIVNEQAKEQVLAATIAFDHLTRQLARPEDGPHYFKSAAFQDPVLRSGKDPDGADGDTSVVVPNGATGFLRDVGFGGHPLENALSENNGDFDTDYTVTAGSYYDKINAILHMSLSEDRFISQSRGDFYDARFRANGLADALPEGYRRVIANALTGDRSILAPHVAADTQGRPLTDSDLYPARPMGWISWWPKNGPTICFASDGRNACTAYDGLEVNLRPELPTRTVPVDPQIGWEVQKFVIAYVLTYITANQQQNWVDMMRIYRLGANDNPEFDARIEWQHPASGQVYYARTYGKECLFGTGPSCTGGKLVEKGIAARILEWANTLTAKGYKLDVTSYPASGSKPAGYNAFGRAMVVRQPDGTPVVVADPALRTITPAGNVGPAKQTCDLNVQSGCVPLTHEDNHWALELEGYKSVPDYLWEMLWRYQMGSPRQLGMY